MAKWNAALECLDRDERVQQQLEQLQVTLNRAYKNVPFYRNRFQAQGLDPYEIGDFESLRKVPFTERSDFTNQYPYGLFAVPLRDIVRIHTAPGTSRNPTVSGYTKADLLVWREIVARALTAAGVGPDDILQIILDPGLANWGRDYKDGAEEIEASVIPLTALPLKKQLMVLRDYKTSVLITNPSAAVQIADLLYQTNLNPNELSLKVVILVGEPVNEDVRNQLEEQLHVKTWVHYGLSETPGPAIGFECDEGAELHISEDHFLFEVLKPSSSEPVKGGEPGELVLTTLTTRAFPLIRFRTGDQVVVVQEPCPCGRTFRRIRWLPQRSDEMLVFHGVKLHHEQILDHVKQVLGSIPQNHAVRLTGSGTARELELWLEMDDKLFSDEIKDLERLVGDLEAELFEDLGVPIAVRLKEHINDV